MPRSCFLDAENVIAMLTAIDCDVIAPDSYRVAFNELIQLSRSIYQTILRCISWRTPRYISDALVGLGNLRDY